MLLDRVLERIPDLALATREPLPQRPNFFISGIEQMPVTFAPVKALGDKRLVLA